MSRLPSLYSPYRFATDANFIVQRRMTVNGVELQKGDPLPADSPLRKLPRRLEFFIRSRYLAIEMQPVPTVPVPKQAPPAVKAAVPAATPKPKAPAVDFGQMTIPQLQTYARNAGVAFSGLNKPQLVQRLKRAAA